MTSNMGDFPAAEGADAAARRRGAAAAATTTTTTSTAAAARMAGGSGAEAPEEAARAARAELEERAAQHDSLERHIDAAVRARRAMRAAPAGNRRASDAIAHQASKVKLVGFNYTTISA